MKILHINTSTAGGAAWCAIRINNALCKTGVQSRMLFAQGDILPNGVGGAFAYKDKIVQQRNNIVISKLRHLLMRIPGYVNVEKWDDLIKRANTDKLFIHHPCSNYSNIANHPLVEWADIVHLHWVNDFVDYRTFFKRVKKPIVWTLHDKYPAVGLMHFCSEYSPLPVQLRDIDQYCREVKKKALSKNKNIHIVAISEHMKRLCLSSDILKDYPCTLIHNGVDTEIFRPYPVENVELSEKDTKVFLFSSYNIWDKRKGLERVIEALEKVDNIEKKLVVLGQNPSSVPPKASFPVICKGLIKDETELSKVYSFADYFIQASYEEGFAQTPLEAMACGIPVISTPVSGASDLIQPFNGVLCNGYDSISIKEGIMQALTKNYNPQKIRDYILERFDYSIIAKQYINLYRSIL